MRLIWSKLASWRLFFLGKDLVLHFKQFQFVGPTFSTKFNIQKCNIFVVFFNSPDASEKVDLMLFLWSARLVRIYSLTSFIKAWKSKLCSFLSFPLGENVLIDLFWQNWRLLKAQSLKSWKSKLCSFCERTAWWKSTHWLLLTNLVAFESSKALRAWKSKLCSQKRSMSRFPPSGKPTKWAKFAFSSF